MALRGLTVSNSTLMLDGQRFRNIGMNWPGAIVKLYGQTSPSACAMTSSADQDAGIAFLQSMKVKVIRVLLFPLYPAQYTVGVLNNKAWNVATNTDRDLYYAYVDAFLAKCRAAGIGVILCFFWRPHSISDLVAGTARDFLTASNARTFATTLIQEVVNRYLTEEAVYGWEWANEQNNYINYNGGVWPGTDVSQGTLASYSPSSSHCFRDNEFASLMTWFYALVRAIDNQRIIMTGNGPNRYFVSGGAGGISYPPNAWVKEQVDDNPTNCGSYHWYGNITYASDNFRGLDALLTMSKHFFKQVGSAFVLGEFGNQPNKLSSITWSGGVVTITVTAGADQAAFEVGDPVLIGGTGTSWDGAILTIATIDSARRLITANTTQLASNWSGSAGRLTDAGNRMQRVLDAVYSANVDVALMWMYDVDTYRPLLESCDETALSFQVQKILAMNTRLGW